MSVPSEEEAARSWAAPPPLPALQRRLSAPAAPGLAADKSTVPHWAASIYLIFTFLWEKVKEPLWLLTSFLLSVVWYCREQLLKWWTVCFQGKKNLTVSAEVDLLAYCAREWKGDTLQARDMRKLPERLLYSQGCNWIQQFSFGPEKYTGSSVFIKLRKCLDFLKNQWTEIIGARDQEQREEMCRILFADEDKEYKLYEAVKFIMLYQVIEAHENMRNGQDIPSFFSLVFTRDTSSDPLSFMMNHLNSVGDTNGLDQVEMFLLGYSLEVKIKVFRLCMFGKEDFLACYPEEYPREWHEVFLVTEDDIHYIIPVVRR
ncbi:inactive ubiquitin thioesterase OTULINL isoform X2 [Rhinatrema bivittatum]|uniref:inactive ubiquitin thioesterase OTULINL isoform X2 n=1 Tax=Rhinatrema bivittatum TaxID=194408 RepID=UPI00112DE47A|nr:inactive ubiquitin thioesterase OTULINL isoform X2 [Rhinatrema bivittatum]